MPNERIRDLTGNKDTIHNMDKNNYRTDMPEERRFKITLGEEKSGKRTTFPYGQRHL